MADLASSPNNQYYRGAEKNLEDSIHSINLDQPQGEPLERKSIAVMYAENLLHYDTVFTVVAHILISAINFPCPKI